LAVLVSLNIGTWANNKIDRRVSEEVAEQKKLSNKNMARVWKTLLPPDEVMDAISSIEGRARKFHIANTFPWVTDGTRLLPTKNYMAYMEFMRRAKIEFEQAVEAFVTKFAELQVMAETALNSIYNPTDYPTAERLKSKYYFETVVTQVPEGSTFQADVESEEATRIREDIEKQVEKSFRNANQALWDQLYGTINKVQERLSNPKGVKESSLQSLREMLALLDRMNVTGDARLEALRKQAEERITGMSAKSLNKDSDKKAIIVAEAARIQASMADIMGGLAHVA
jgi:hypothetical protein